MKITVTAGENDLLTTAPKWLLNELDMEECNHLSLDLTSLHLGSKAFLPWRCERGHQWREVLRNRVRGTGCPYCSGKRVAPENSLSVLCPELVMEWSSSNKDTPEDVAPSLRRHVQWICPLGHEWRGSPWNRTRGQSCPYCGNKATLPGYNDLATTHPALWGEAVPGQEPCRFNESQRRVLWRCGECAHEWSSSPRNRAIRGDGCPSCSLIRVSQQEREVRSFIEEMGLLPIYNDRTLLEGRELDIYIPELNLAIEVNGDYWHSFSVIMRNFCVTPEEHHWSKHDQAAEAGVALAYLWQGDWISYRAEMEGALGEFIATGVVPKVLSKLVAPGERCEE